MHPLFAFALSPLHLLVVAAIGVLVFGRRLPEIGKSLGKGIVEFKKGLNGIEDEVSNSVMGTDTAAKEPVRPPQRVSSTAPRFDETV
jgi:sec-independent protein translocase protein TatA